MTELGTIERAYADGYAAARAEIERLRADLARMTKNEDLQMHRAIRAEALNAELVAALRPFARLKDGERAPWDAVMNARNAIAKVEGMK